jgi:hypothetical protein
VYPKPNIVPPGGFHYEEPGLRIDGPSYQAVAEELLKWRLKSALPVGDPLADVMNYVCSRHPHFCTEPDIPQAIAMPRRPALLARVTQWMASLWRSATRSDKRFVTSSKAEERAQLCAKCPHNVEWKSGCSSCVETTTRLGYTFRAGRQVSLEKSLHACDLLGQENSTAVWLEGPAPADPDTHKSLPSFCWRK